MNALRKTLLAMLVVGILLALYLWWASGSLWIGAIVMVLVLLVLVHLYRKAPEKLKKAAPHS